MNKVFPPYVKDDSLSGRILGGQWPLPLALFVVIVIGWMAFHG